MSFDAIVTDGDNVHVFVGSEPKYSPSRLMQIIKSVTARKIFKQYLKIKNSYGVMKCGVMVDILETVEEGTTSGVIETMLKIGETKKKKQHISN